VSSELLNENARENLQRRPASTFETGEKVV
jgi:hypothetical protein